MKKKAKVKKPTAAERKAALVKVAEDILDNKIFTSNHVQEQNMVTMVFPILSFLDKKTLAKMQKDDVTLVYEYVDKAAPRGVNGYPMFFSCRFLTRGEATEMWGYYERMKAAKEAAKAGL